MTRSARDVLVSTVRLPRREVFEWRRIGHRAVISELESLGYIETHRGHWRLTDSGATEAFKQLGGS